MSERELRRERPIQLERRPIRGPDSVSIHPDRDHPAREADSDPAPVAATRVVADLPRTPTADDREHESPTGPDQARALARDAAQVGYAVERAEVGVRAIVASRPLEAVELLRAERQGAHPLAHERALGARGGPACHERRPVGRQDAVSLLCHADGIEARAAAELEELA